MFLYGEPGWCKGTRSLKNVNGVEVPQGKRASTIAFYSYRLMVRNNGNYLHHFGRLLRQYAVDMYVEIENSRPHYLATHQQDLCVELYSGLEDSVRADDSNMNSFDRRAILPLSKAAKFFSDQ